MNILLYHHVQLGVTLVALFSGPIIYVLPIITAIAAILTIVYKYILGNKKETFIKEITKIKKERQESYDYREKIYEDIFENLQEIKKECKDYYCQIASISYKCDELTKSTYPYKEKKHNLETKKEIINKLFDYVFASIAAIIIPLLFSFVDFGVVIEIISVGVFSMILLVMASIDEKLTEKIEKLEDIINDIKSDRTVAYVKRDIKLEESLTYLKKEKVIS